VRAFKAEEAIFSCHDTYGQWWNTSMVFNSTTGFWEAIVPPQLVNDVIEFHVVVFDSEGNMTLSKLYSYDVKIMMAEDINRDGKIDIYDVARVAKLFGTVYDP